MRRCLVAALALLVVPLLVVLASPAHACSCVKGGVAKHLRQADVVFTGVVHDPVVADQLRIAAVEVSRVFKGSVAERTDVVTAEQGPACGIDLVEGTEIIVFGSLDSDGVATQQCDGSGTRLHPDHPALGAGSAPDPGELVSDRRPPPVRAVWWWVGGGALLLLGAAYAVRRRFRSPV